MNNKTSEILCAIIVAYRALGILKEESRQAMIELMIRQENGDTFDFEDYINKKLNDLPKQEVNPGIKNLISVLGMIK